MFKQIDIDCSNTVDLEEIKEYLERSLGENFDDDSYNNFLDEYLYNKSIKELSFSEFKQLYHTMAVKLYKTKFSQETGIDIENVENNIKYDINDN